MKFILPILLFTLLFPLISFPEEKPRGIVRQISLDGKVSKKKLKILTNKLYDSLGKYFQLVPKDELIKVRKEVLNELGKKVDRSNDEGYLDNFLFFIRL